MALPRVPERWIFHTPGVSMAVRRNEVAHETIVRVRTDYANGKRFAEIEAGTGLSRGTIYKIIDGEYGDGGLPALRRRHLTRSGPRSREGREALVARLWNTADRQVREIDKRLRRGEQPPDERERDARVFAVLVRTLRELNAFDEATNAAGASTDAADENDDMPKDIDEFRNELARRIHALVDERERAPDTAGAERAGD